MLEEPRDARRLKAWAAIEIVAILRDAVLRTAPLDEAGVCGKADNKAYARNAVSTSFTQYEVPTGITSSLKL